MECLIIGSEENKNNLIKKKNMKKLFTILAIAISSIAYSQKIGIKLKVAETFTVVPARLSVADSVSVDQITDNGYSVTVAVSFYKKNDYSNSRSLILWEGEAYKENEDWSNETVIARIKVLLDIQK